LERVHNAARDESTELHDEFHTARQHFVLGADLMQRRLDLDLTQAKLAEASGIDQADISKIERGLANSTLATLTILARQLGCAIRLVPAGDPWTAQVASETEKGGQVGEPVAHFEIHGSEDLRSFYADLFDWDVDADNPMHYGVVNTHGEGGISGGIAEDDESWVTVYVQVEDLQAALDKAEKLGGKTVQPPMDVPGGPSLAIFTDPSGNRMGLVKGM